MTEMEELDINARLSALAQQRENAMNQVVLLSAKNAILEKEKADLHSAINRMVADDEKRLVNADADSCGGAAVRGFKSAS